MSIYLHLLINLIHNEHRKVINKSRRTETIPPRTALSSLLRLAPKKAKESSSLATIEEDIRDKARKALLKELDVKDEETSTKFSPGQLANMMEEEVTLL